MYVYIVYGCTVYVQCMYILCKSVESAILVKLLLKPYQSRYNSSAINVSTDTSLLTTNAKQRHDLSRRNTKNYFSFSFFNVNTFFTSARWAYFMAAVKRVFSLCALMVLCSQTWIFSFYFSTIVCNQNINRQILKQRE